MENIFGRPIIPLTKNQQDLLRGGSTFFLSYSLCDASFVLESDIGNTSFITSVADTPTIDLNVAGDQLTATSIVRKEPVADYASLPAGLTVGETRQALDTYLIWTRDGAAWVDAGLAKIRDDSTLRTAFLDLDASLVAVDHILISSVDTGAGTIAIGDATTQRNGGYSSALLPGAVGTASTAREANALNETLNLARVVDSTTGQDILNGGGSTIYGLLQATNTVVDGDAIGGAGSENLQVSFVTVSGDGLTYNIETVTADVDIVLYRNYSQLNQPATRGPSYPYSDFVTQSPAALQADERVFTVTADFAVAEVITISTGAGSITGTSTPSGDAILLPVDAPTFNNDGGYIVVVVGVGEVVKGDDVVWDSTDSLHFTNTLLAIGDKIIVRRNQVL